MPMGVCSTFNARHRHSHPLFPPPTRDDPLGVAQALRGIPVGKNSVTNYRGLPAVSYHDMTDFDLQQEVCVKAGITGRIISNPFAAEVMTAISRKPAIDVVKHVNDRTAAVVARAKSNWGLGTLFHSMQATSPRASAVLARSASRGC